MEKLPGDFKQKWIAALRSGEYEQAKSTLRSETGYCCLGVACSIAGIKPSIDGFCYPNRLAIAHPDCIPAFFRDCNIESPAWRLAAMNDSGNTFPEIADWIEENL